MKLFILAANLALTGCAMPVATEEQYYALAHDCFATGVRCGILAEKCKTDSAAYCGGAEYMCAMARNACEGK